MGNSHCVPQAPRRLRASFSRKPSLKGNREDGARMPAGLLGPEAARSGDAAANKLFHYIPGADILDLENQRENLEQPFLSVFKKARRRVPVRNLGKVVHYAKVQLRFQHSQDVSDCYLELFPAHLYFQAHGSEGLTFQVRQWAVGVGPWPPFSPWIPEAPTLCLAGAVTTDGAERLPAGGVPRARLPDHRPAARTPPGALPQPSRAGPLALPPGEADGPPWGAATLPLGTPTGVLWRRAPLDSATPPNSAADSIRARTRRQCCLCLEGQAAAPARTGGWEVHGAGWEVHGAVGGWEGCRVLGRAGTGPGCTAAQPPYRLTPSTQEQWDRLLVLYPTSLAIFSEELDGLCFKGELPLRAVHINLEEKEKQIHSFLIEGPLINTIRVVCASYEDYSHWLLCLRAVTHREGAPPLPGAKSFPGLQVTGSGRGSLSSGGRTSWDSGCLVPPSTRTSHSLPESSVPSTVGCSSQHTSDQANSDRTSVGRRRTELRRSSSRSPRSKARAEGCGPATPLHLDLTQLNRLSLENSPDAPDHASETSHSPLYADPYTPPATSHRRVTDVRGLEEFLSAMQSSPGPVPLSPLPLVPVSVPASDPGSSSSGPTGPHLLSKKGVLQSRASQRQRGSAKDGEPQPPDSPQLVSSAREGLPEPQLPLTDGWSSRRSQGPGYDHLWDETLSSSHRKCPQLGGPEASAGLVQWI
ncbi:PREDICTED: pleckstrin homology domain-containing family N member 1 isoform X2 [Rhinopithecus bieti]|uniref:pleckstrin homology domain-containing family N member 1 isoform X2 n=1 Tax=Rhinopithecus bieti TaxID=61621 RepID=UPI00083BCE25|nr:PREDICTED: pleckstrin homology domain-containing family N member 1 isoform X2 [Rhinopithecus bieti]